MRNDRQNQARQGVVLSDLHLFSRRSRGHALFEALKPRLAGVRIIVLNGDTFDFRWSTLRSHAASEEAALNWLLDLLKDHPEGDIHFILGNHDCLETFREKLHPFTADKPRLHWHEHSLRLGSSLFLHGDVTHRKMDMKALEHFRAPWVRDRRRGEWAAATYSVLDRLGAPRLAHAFWHHPRHRTVKRITHHLDHALPGWRKETRDCYFGHTHLPFSDFEFEGIRYHNTGSAIRHLKFNPLFFQVPSTDDVRDGS